MLFLQFKTNIFFATKKKNKHLFLFLLLLYCSLDSFLEVMKYSLIHIFLCRSSSSYSKIVTSALLQLQPAYFNHWFPLILHLNHSNYISGSLYQSFHINNESCFLGIQINNENGKYISTPN